MRSVQLGFMAIGGLLLALGCGGPAAPTIPPLHPVQGVVTLDGKPLAEATVTFNPVKSTKGQGGYGSTNEKGEFEIKYTGNDAPGCPEGDYKVTFQKLVMRDGTPLTDKSPPGASAEAKNLVPPKYSKFDDLINVVAIGSGGKTDLKFELKGK